MNDSRSEHMPMLLGERFLNGTITPDEAQELLDRLVRDPNMAEHFRQNVLVDFLLREDGDLERRAREAAGATQSFDDGAGSEIGLFDIPADKAVNSTVNVQSYLPRKESGLWSKLFAFGARRSNRGEKTGHAPRVGVRPGKPSQIPLTIAAIAIVCLLFVIVMDRYHRPGSVHDAGIMVAKVVDTVDAVWEDGTFPFRRGQETGPNRLFLKSGMVKLRFIDETELILKGPGEYTVNNAKDVFCSRGSLSARVNDRKSGFGITTPSATVVDRGTEFFVDVEKDDMQVGVVTGRVDLVPRQLDASSPKVVPMTEGTAMRTNMISAPCGIPFDRTRFISGTRFQQFLKDYVQREGAKRVETIRLLDSMPDMLARFDFGQDAEPSVPNVAAYGRNKCASANIYGCGRDEGRFEGTKSLRFDSKASRVELALSGSYDSLTLLADVRIRTLSNWGSILFAAGDSMMSEGAFLWQITKKGEIHLLVKSKENEIVAPFHTEPVFTRQSWGGWYRLAVVLDSRNKTIAHYVDGRLVASFPWNDAAPLKPNRATIGNASPQDKSALNRFLDGNIENFVIVGKALTPDEIEHFK